MNQDPMDNREEAMLQARSVLKAHWGFDDFRDYQLGPVQDLAMGKNVVAVLPTGGGKTICYQVPALVRGGLCIVVSPLIALMKDQIDGLRRKGIRCEAIVSGSAEGDAERALDNAATGALQFLYISPERIQHPLFQARVGSLPIRTIAVDEAHCISQWGHDFRPAYRNIQALRQWAPHAAWGAFTATATPEVFDDIGTQLGLLDAHRHRSPMRRPNLAYAVVTTGDPETQLLQTALSMPGSGLVYVGTRMDAEKWADRLTKAGLSTSAFHAGLTSHEKQNRQRDWVSGKLQVMACTSAFGMGIDKPNVRWVLHAHVPLDLESYVQEAGRAGRDGAHADCILFASPAACSQSARRLARRFPDESLIRKVYQALADAGSVAIGDQPSEETRFDAQSWALRKGERADEVKSALALLDQSGWISIRQVPQDQVTWQWLATPMQVQRHIDAGGLGVELLDAMLRSPRAFVQPEEATPKRWAAHLNLPLEDIEKWLAQWDRQGLINLQSGSSPWAVQWLSPRMQSQQLKMPRALYSDRRKQLESKWQDMQDYIQHKACRSLQIDRYFGDSADGMARCGVCDLCQAQSWNWKHWVHELIPESGIAAEELLASFPPALRDHAVYRLKEMRAKGEIYTLRSRVFLS
jgi:ATP-dependent DNA helicase RecQ